MWHRAAAAISIYVRWLLLSLCSSLPLRAPDAAVLVQAADDSQLAQQQRAERADGRAGLYIAVRSQGTVVRTVRSLSRRLRSACSALCALL